MLDLLKAAILGIVEGITEWLPISSTGHMILVDEIIQLHVTEEFMKMFLRCNSIGGYSGSCGFVFPQVNPFDRGKNSGTEDSHGPSLD